MQADALQSGWDNIIVALPFVVMLGFGMFHLDALVAAPKSGAEQSGRIPGTDERGEPIVCDPDGRPSK